jgi:hypothetical protein
MERWWRGLPQSALDIVFEQVLQFGSFEGRFGLYLPKQLIR